MPHTVTITGQQYQGTYTYYSKKEADDLGIRYFTPPFEGGGVPKTGFVLTSNNWVVPIIGARNTAKRTDYITPFGTHHPKTMPFMDGRVFTRGVTLNNVTKKQQDWTNLAHWLVRNGDVQIAHRMAFGFAAPPDVEDTIRHPNFQLILQSEFDRMADEQGFPKGVIVEERIKQTKLMTEVLETIKSRIVDGKELDPTHVELFKSCFNAQQGNLTDLEQGYVRTPPEPEPAMATLEATYRTQVPQTAGGFHMQKTERVEDAQEVPEHAHGLEHPEGYNDLSLRDPNEEVTDDAGAQGNEIQSNP